MGLNEQFSHERAWRKGPGIADGADIEQAILGIPVIPPKERQSEYMPFSDAIEYAKQHQPNALSRSRIVRDLRESVAGLCSDIETAVKFYTAVGTPLDTFHGVDAFFEQGRHRVTLDISLRDKETHKADVLLHVDFDGEGRPVASTGELARVAHEIADRFNKAVHSRKAA
jgi:hypothetical protein